VLNDRRKYVAVEDVGRASLVEELHSPRGRRGGGRGRLKERSGEDLVVLGSESWSSR
jgi:hypothetical protein